jgi:hypothetical protein
MPARRGSQAIALGSIAVAMALPAGCGSEGGSATTSTGPLTKAELVANGDAICRQGVERYTQAQQNPPTTPAQAADLTARLIAITNDELAQLRDLNAPHQVSAALDRYLRARQHGVAILNQEVRAARSNDPNAFAAARARMAGGQVDRLKLARAVGFEDCSRPGAGASGA